MTTKTDKYEKGSFILSVSSYKLPYPVMSFLLFYFSNVLLLHHMVGIYLRCIFNVQYTDTKEKNKTDNSFVFPILLEMQKILK